MTWLLERLGGHARRQGEQTALDDGTDALSYADLWRRVTRLSEDFKERGVHRLALTGGNGIGWVVADLAAQHRGITVVPVPPFFSDQQQRHLLHDANLDTVYDGITGAFSSTGIDTAGTPDGIGKITFTSGSTGHPKGVCLSSDHLDRTVRSLADALAPHGGNRHLCVLPLATLLENVAGVYVPLSLGARVLVPALETLGFGGSSRLNPGAFHTALRHWRPQSLILVPELLRVLTLMASKGLPLPDSFRFIAVGGGKVDPALLLRARDLGLPVYEGYGLSECGSVVALNLPGTDRPGSVGRPLAHAGITVDDSGEIQVSGAVMSGYLGQPAVEPWATGDLGYFDQDGFLHVNGRRKNLLITAFGRNVNPEWVESAFQGCDTIHGMVVQGDGEPHLTAVVVPMPHADPSRLRQQIASVNPTLPDYARIGALIIADAPFSADNGLATTNGRPRREAIRERYPNRLATPVGSSFE
ncbi:MAG: AMP-binding protein [Alcanivorax sp.]|nr:AMP-binding protein [Alcanivorax sp.]